MHDTPICIFSSDSWKDRINEDKGRCVCGRQGVGREAEVSVKDTRISFFGKEEAILECFNPLSLVFTFPPTFKYLSERDTSPNNLISVNNNNHKSLHSCIVLKAKRGPARKPARIPWSPATYRCKLTMVCWGGGGRWCKSRHCNHRFVQR